MPRTRKLRASLALALALFGCDSGGPPTSNHSINQAECAQTTTEAWHAQVVRFIPPYRLGWCPMVLPGVRDVSGHLVINVLMSNTGQTSLGWIAHANLWQKHIAADAQGTPAPDIHAFNQDFSFDTFDPNVVVGTEQTARAQIDIPITAGFLPATGTNEVDSLSVFYDGNQSYNGSSLAALMSKTPVVRSNEPGSVTGFASVMAGNAATWHVFTDWDTTGYRYQWYVNDSPSYGDTANTFTKSFSTIGTYTLRADQILGDESRLSSYLTVTVPFMVGIAGPSVADQYSTVSYQADAPGGYAPYTYQWTYDGASVGSGATLQLSTGSPGFHTLNLSVSEGSGHSGNASLQICVKEPGGPDCAY
jgi:hypothetical protein